jgi:hypothetical protein
MEKKRDWEAERQELLRQIESALPDAVRRGLQACSQCSLVSKVTVSTNEVGTAYADQG